MVKNERWNSRLKDFLGNPSGLLVAGMLILIGFFHYYRICFFSFSTNAFLSRHAVDRILFLFPIVIATYKFNLHGGLLTLVTVIVFMLPRAIWISDYPADALVETCAVILVGYYLVYLIHSLTREKILRQEADARQIQIQQRLNEVSEQITAELELDRILTKVMQVAEELTGANSGGIALLDPESEKARYPYLHNLPQELTKISFSEGEGIVGEVIRTGYPQIVDNYQHYFKANPAFIKAGLVSVVAVPILKGERVFGALSLISTEKSCLFSDKDVDTLTGIGRLAGIAIENARLYERMRFYARQITSAQEDERKRIARELHDDTIQMLIALSRHIEGLTVVSEKLPKMVLNKIDRIQELVGTTLRSLRRFIQDLRPPLLDHLGLVAALEALTTTMSEDHIATELSVVGEVWRMPPEKELVLFRIVQEALNNARRHSGASNILVQVQFLSGGHTRISIEDNGQGFAVPERVDDLVASGRLGLVGMHERARMLGGTLTIRSGPDDGTSITVEVGSS